ncbi:MAG TPA: hypothetical protein ENI51_10215, partial [Candidatus Atribacteria bacterium]|nr:hypothetical protein [Candidatus Atribacteria bacterium]
MRRFIWLGTLFLSSSWLFLLHIFTPPEKEEGFIILALGILFVILSFSKDQSEIIAIADKKYIYLLAILLPSCLLIPYPFNIGSITLFVGLIFFLISVYFTDKKFSWIWYGVVFSGLILLFQAAIYYLFALASCLNHKLNFLIPFFSTLLKIFGLNASYNNDTIYIVTATRIYPFIVTVENLGLHIWINIFATALLIFFFVKNKKDVFFNLSLLFLFSIFYISIRYVFLIALYVEKSEFKIFWDPFNLFLSYIPFALILFATIFNKNFEIDFKYFRKISKNHFLNILLTFVLIFSITSVFVFHDPGKEKNGKILIDETHSEWESTLLRLDKKWYGKLSVYNYYSLTEWLKHYYEIHKNTNHSLGYEYIKNYDILILKCPTKPYLLEEIRSIERFVREGGGLFLIGDHTNVFGMNEYLNQVAQKFGIKFNFDSTYDLKTGMWSIYEPQQGILPHPIMLNVNKFYFLTSCSLEAPINCEPVIIGYSLSSLPGTYASRDFFPEGTTKTNSIYGLLLQSVAMQYGKGRIVAFSDSTCFSNYCIFMDGYPSYILGVMNYLNRENQWLFLDYVFLFLSIASGMTLFYLFKRGNKGFNAIFLSVMAVAAFCLSTSIFSTIDKSVYMDSITIKKERNFNTVGFLMNYSNAIISSHLTYEEELQKKRFNTFFVWTQRVELIPSLEYNLDLALKNKDIIVIINPNKPFSSEDISAIESYVENGGKLLLIDSIFNSKSTANELLRDFDMKVVVSSEKDMVKYNES